MVCGLLASPTSYDPSAGVFGLRHTFDRFRVSDWCSVVLQIQGSFGMLCSRVHFLHAAVLCGGCFLASPSGFAAAPSLEVDQCLQRAASKHNVSYVLVRSIAEQESSFNPHAVRKPHTAGGDATTDFGLMQINSGWLSTLRKYGISKEDLFSPCINADVGAWILADNIRRHGLTWNAVGAYNAQTHWKRVKYATGVHSKVQRFLTSRAKPAANVMAESKKTKPAAWQTADTYPVRTSADAPAQITRSMAVWEASHE
jgi:Transglycosylase SLT domain